MSSEIDYRLNKQRKHILFTFLIFNSGVTTMRTCERSQNQPLPITALSVDGTLVSGGHNIVHTEVTGLIFYPHTK